MGYPDHIFLDEARADALTCGICLDVLEAAVSVCEEGHRYCRACVADLSQCPECRLGVVQLHRLREVNEEISGMRVFCEHPGLEAPRCTWEGPLRDRQVHCTTCPSVGLRQQLEASRTLLHNTHRELQNVQNELHNRESELQSVQNELQAARRVIRNAVEARERAEERQGGTVLRLTIRTFTQRSLQMQVERAMNIATFKRLLAERINATAQSIYLGTRRGPLNNADPTVTLDAMGVVDQDVLHMLPLDHHLARRVAMQQAQLQEVA